MHRMVKAILIGAGLALAGPGMAAESINLSIATGGTGGVYYPLGGGMALIGVGDLMLTAIGPDSGWQVLTPGLVVSGVGVGLAVPVLSSAALHAAPGFGHAAQQRTYSGSPAWLAKKAEAQQASLVLIHMPTRGHPRPLLGWQKMFYNLRLARRSSSSTKQRKRHQRLSQLQRDLALGHSLLHARCLGRRAHRRSDLMLTGLAFPYH